MGDQMTKAWYLVYAKPRQELVARNNLMRQGYETYLPLMRKSRRKKGKPITAVAPMFPRYLFVYLDRQTDDWGPIRSTLGVVSLVRFGHMPAHVPDDFVRMLRTREDSDGLQVLPVADYKKGAKIRMSDGGLAGYEGIFIARSGRDRVTVLLKIMGKYARTTVAAAIIEPLS